MVLKYGDRNTVSVDKGIPRVNVMIILQLGSLGLFTYLFDSNFGDMEGYEGNLVSGFQTCVGFADFSEVRS